MHRRIIASDPYWSRWLYHRCRAPMATKTAQHICRIVPSSDSWAWIAMPSISESSAVEIVELWIHSPDFLPKWASTMVSWASRPSFWCFFLRATSVGTYLGVLIPVRRFMTPYLYLTSNYEFIGTPPGRIPMLTYYYSFGLGGGTIIWALNILGEGGWQKVRCKDGTAISR